MPKMRRLASARQRYCNQQGAPILRRSGDFSFVCRDDGLGNGETDPITAGIGISGWIGAVKPVEHVLQILLRNGVG